VQVPTIDQHNPPRESKEPAIAYLSRLALFPRRQVYPGEFRWLSQTPAGPLKWSMAMREDQCQHVTHHTSYHEGYKRLLLYASPNGLGRIACLDHCFAIGILRFAGYLATLFFEHQCDQCQSSQG
jgi:hypothetical protein